jgi:hypothetical protein
MSGEQTASERIVNEVTSWPGVEAGWGSRGEFALRVGRREIGHLHGDRVAHFGFPKALWSELYSEGRIEYHPVFPDKRGPASRQIADDADVLDVIAIMRLNYDRVIARHGLPEDADARRVA